MIRYILTALNIDSLPRWLLFYLFLLSTALGGFYALLFVTAFSEFMAFHDLSKYPQILILSGLCGVLLFGLYQFFYRKLHPKKAFYLLFGLLIVMIGIFGYLPHLTSFSRSLVLLVLWLPFATVSEHAFYRTVESFDSIKEQQNLRRFIEFGIIGGTAFSGMLLSVFASNSLRIPFTTASLACLGISVGVFFLISQKVTFRQEEENPKEVDHLISLIKNSRLKKMAVMVLLFVMLSITNFVFIDFTFLTSLDKVYTSEIPFTQFMGFFLSVIMVVNLLFKLFVYRNLLKTFSVYKALQFSPAFLALMVLSTAVILFFRGTWALTNPYSVLFLTVVFSRFFSFLLRESFEYYSIKLFFTSIETYSGRIVSRFLRVSLNLWAFIFSGLLLLMVQWSLKPTVLELVMINVGLALFWLVISIFLSKYYASTLEKIKTKLTDDFLHRREPSKPDYFNYIANRIEFSSLDEQYTQVIEVQSESTEQLIQWFQKLDTDTNTQISIIRKLSGKNSEKARSFLFSKLLYPNKWIVSEISQVLQIQKESLTASEIQIITEAIHKAIGSAAWLLSMDVSLRGMNVSLRFVNQAIREEYEVTLLLLFDLLKLIYSDGLVELVKTHTLNEASNEQREFSLEMLNQTLRAETKPYLLPLLHNNRKREKVLQLSTLFPVELKEPSVALREMINTDLGTISLWTKACALNAFAGKYGLMYSEDLFAQLFNDELLLAEIAYVNIRKANHEIPSELFNRLPKTLRLRLISIMDGEETINLPTTFQRVQFLKTLPEFKKVKGLDLIPFATALNECLPNSPLEIRYKNLFCQTMLITSDSANVQLSQGHKMQISYGRLMVLPIGKEVVIEGAPVFYLETSRLKPILLQRPALLEAMQRFLEEAIFLN